MWNFLASKKKNVIKKRRNFDLKQVLTVTKNNFKKIPPATANTSVCGRLPTFDPAVCVIEWAGETKVGNRRLPGVINFFVTVSA